MGILIKGLAFTKLHKKVGSLLLSTCMSWVLLHTGTNLVFSMAYIHTYLYFANEGS